MLPFFSRENESAPYFESFLVSALMGSGTMLLAGGLGAAGVHSSTVDAIGLIGVAILPAGPLCVLCAKTWHGRYKARIASIPEDLVDDATRRRQRYQTIEALHDARYPRDLRSIRDAAWRTAFDWRDMTDHMPSQVVVRGDHALRVLVDAANETYHGLEMDLLGRPLNSDGTLEDSLEQVTRQVIDLLQSDIDQVRANFHGKALSSTRSLSWQLDRYALPVVSKDDTDAA